MHNSAILKNNAKAVLKKTYAISLALMIVMECMNQFPNILNEWADMHMQSYYFKDNFDLNYSISLLFLAFQIIFIFYIINIFEVGTKRFFLKTQEGETRFFTLFFAFCKGRYMSCVKAMALRFLYVLGWSFLFIIPGIIKAFEYFCVPYILAENPNIDSSRVLKISSRMTYGYKYDLFILSLSFLGWFVLGLAPYIVVLFVLGLDAGSLGDIMIMNLAIITGLSFVKTYMQATFAEMYTTMKQNAIKWETVMPEDFGQRSFSYERADETGFSAE